MMNLHIGEVADLFGISTKTLRHYEKMGLVSPSRLDNGYRMYTPDDVRLIQQIRQLQSLGLSLRRIKQILAQENSEQAWEDVLQSLLDETDEAIDALEERRERIAQLLDEGAENVLAVEAIFPEYEPVTAYLTEYLSAEQQLAWRRDQTIIASLYDAEFTTVSPSLPIPLSPFLPLMEVSR